MHSKTRLSSPGADAQQELPANAPPAPPAPADNTVLQAALIHYALKYDVPVPLKFVDELISRSDAFKARREGQLELEDVRSRAGVRLSELARYLKKEPRVTAPAVTA